MSVNGSNDPGLKPPARPRASSVAPPSPARGRDARPAPAVSRLRGRRRQQPRRRLNRRDPASPLERRLDEPLVGLQERLELRAFARARCRHRSEDRRPMQFSSSSRAASVTDRSRSSVGLIRRRDRRRSRAGRSAAQPRQGQTAPALDPAGQPRHHQRTDRRRGRRRGSSAGTMTSVRTPQTTMLWPMSAPSCCRLGKLTNIRP